MHTGLYTIDPFHSFAGPAGRTEGYDALLTIAGLGGTGAFLAEDLARLLTVHFGWRAHFHLADYDRVEIHNTQCQAGLRGISACYATNSEHAFEVRHSGRCAVGPLSACTQVPAGQDVATDPSRSRPSPKYHRGVRARPSGLSCLQRTIRRSPECR